MLNEASGMQGNSECSYQNKLTDALRCCTVTDSCTHMKGRVTIFIYYYYLFILQ